MSAREGDEDDVCGFTFDHDENVTYEDAECVQWVCRRCGAEGFVDLTGANDE